MSTIEPPDHDLPSAPMARPPVEPLIFKTEPQTAYGAAMSELGSLVRDLMGAHACRRIFFLVVALLGVLVMNMVGQLYLNRWQGGFYHAIEKRDLAMIGGQIVLFVEIVALLLTVVVAQTWLHERFKIRLREWLTNHFLNNWLVSGRPYRLGISSDDAVNPDQRIQDDVRNFSEFSADLGTGLVQSVLLLVSFIGVLWAMSKNIHYFVHGHDVIVPGYMVWVALLYAAGGSMLTARVGRPLIDLNEKRYSNEADFRFSIVRANESAESIAFYQGEVDERRSIDGYFSKVLSIMGKMSFALARLTWITSGYGWIMIALPVVVALPGYLQGTLDLGGLMMVVGAFNQVQASLRWFVDNFPKIADWRSALHRVVVFRNAISLIDVFDPSDEQIQLVDHPEKRLAFEGLKISLIDGNVVVADATANIMPGERVLITGESGSGKSTLFRAVAGLWPWGAGVIKLPPRNDMMFLPQRPYIPLGTLAGSLSYPRQSNETSREQMEVALTRVNLGEFISMLDVDQRWDKLMSLGQQQRLAFARLLIHKPEWVFLDEATSALDENNQDMAMSIFTKELESSAVMSIGHRPGLEKYHSRTLHLISTTEGTILRRRPHQPSKGPPGWINSLKRRWLPPLPK